MIECSQPPDRLAQQDGCTEPRDCVSEKCQALLARVGEPGRQAELRAIHHHHHRHESIYARTLRSSCAAAVGRARVFRPGGSHP